MVKDGNVSSLNIKHSMQFLSYFVCYENLDDITVFSQYIKLIDRSRGGIDLILDTKRRPQCHYKRMNTLLINQSPSVLVICQK